MCLIKHHWSDFLKAGPVKAGQRHAFSITEAQFKFTIDW